MSYLDLLRSLEPGADEISENAKSGGVESVETPDLQGLDTLDTPSPGVSEKNSTPRAREPLPPAHRSQAVYQREKRLAGALPAACARAGTDPAIVPRILEWLGDWKADDLDDICATPALADAALSVAPSSMQFRRWRRATSTRQ